MTDFAVRKDSTEIAGDAVQTNHKVIVAALVAVVILGFVLRYFLLAKGAIVNGDGIFYVWRAQTLMTGDLWNGISAYWSPLYSLLIGVVGYPIQDLESGGRIVSLLAGTFLIPLTYYLGNLLFDRTSGVIAGLLIALHAPWIQASTWVMTEALYGLLFLGMIVTGWLALSRSSLSYWALTGFLIGLAYLTKPEALAFLFLFLIFTLVVVVANRTNVRKLFIGSAIMTFVVAGCVVPYVLFLHAKTGEWTISKKASTNTLSGVDEDQQRRLTKDGQQTIMDELWGDEYLGTTTDKDLPVAGNEGASPSLRTKFGWAYGLLRKQVDELLPALLSFAFIPLMIIGLFSSPWTRFEATRNLYLGAFVISTLVGYSFAVTNIRYLLAIIPLLLILTAHGSIVLARWLSESVAKISGGSIRLPNSLAQALAVVTLVLLSTPSIIAKFDAPDISGTPMEEQRAGLWLRSQVGDAAPTVMASNATVAYYAGGHHLFMPDEEIGTILDYAKNRKTDFIVFSTRRLARNKRSYPEISAGLERDLELVYSDVDDERFKIRIYKVRR